MRYSICICTVPDYICNLCFVFSICLCVFFILSLYAYFSPFASSFVLFVWCKYGIIWIHVYFWPVYITYVTRLICLVSGSFFAD